MTEFLKNNLTTVPENIPNCFAFKIKIEDDYKVCICPRIDDKWSELDIFYEQDTNNQLIKAIENDLDPEYFNVIFLFLKKQENSDQFDLVANNPQYLRSNELKSMDLYNEGKFFELVEAGYLKCYFDKTLENNEIELIPEQNS